MIKLGILASTAGTDMQAILDADNLDAEIKVVIANKQCFALERAKKYGIKHVLVDPSGKKREEYDKEVAKILDKQEVDLIILIGYMRYLSPWFVHKYENKIMNIHPSLLPAFAGGMDLNVHEEVLKRGCKITGCTLHFVDEGEDTGPIISQQVVKIEENETANSLKDKVQRVEKQLILRAINWFAAKRLKVKNGKVIKL